LKRGLRELRAMTYVPTEKLSATIDKGKKPGHFWKIKISSPDTTQ